MFVVSEADAEAILNVNRTEGRAAAIAELRRRYQGIVDPLVLAACLSSMTSWARRDPAATAASPPWEEPPTIRRLAPRGRRGMLAQHW